MTKTLFDLSPYLKSCEATIVRIFDNNVVLDQTVFYPLSGGQLGDGGSLVFDDVDYEIIDTKWGENNEIIHELDRTLDVNLISNTVSLKLDWDRRFKLMSMLTSLHILCTLLDYPIVGAKVGPNKSHLDFFVENNVLDKDKISDELNSVLDQKLDVITTLIAEKTTFKSCNLMDKVQRIKNGILRYVQIGNKDEYFNERFCGGTHVRNTNEISKMEISKIKSKGKGNRRVVLEFVQ